MPKKNQTPDQALAKWLANATKPYQFGGILEQGPNRSLRPGPRVWTGAIWALAIEGGFALILWGWHWFHIH